MAVMQESVQDRGGDHGVAEYRAPFSDRAVAGHEHHQPRSALVAPTHQLEEQVSGVRLEGQVVQFVDDQQLWLSEVHQLFTEPAFGVSTGPVGRSSTSNPMGLSLLRTAREGA